MTTSGIEITDRAYLITLARSDFEYREVRRLLTILFAERRTGKWTCPLPDEPMGTRPHEMAGRFDSLADK